MIAQVVPLRRLPRALGAFDYAVPAGFRAVPGAIVQIKFRARPTVGVVLRLASSSAVRQKLLPLEAVLSRGAYVPPALLRLAAYVSGQGFCSIATTLRSMLPALPRQRLSRLPIPTFREPPAPTAAQASSYDQLLGTNQPVALVTYFREQTKIDFYRQLIAAAQGQSSSVLLITPTNAAAQSLSRLLPSNHCLNHRTSVIMARQNYETILRQLATTVIGTRSALFAPVQRLGLIIIDDEDADEHLQEEPNPRYDARAVAVFMSKLTSSRVVMTSRLPSLVTTRSYPLARALDAPPNTGCRFVDLDQARQAGDFGMLTETVQAAVSQAAQDGQSVVLLHHRRGDFGSVECQDCGYVISCPSCNVPMRLEKTALLCRHCSRTDRLPDRCPRCRSLTLRGRGRGAEALRRELKAQLGLQSQLATDPGRSSPAKVIIATDHQLDRLPPENYSLGVITRFDSLLAVPRADADERARRLVLTLASRLSPRGTLIIQGSAQTRTICQDLTDRRWSDEAYAVRERFGYPPAWRLIALRRRIESRAPGISPSELQKRLSVADPKLRIDGPIRSTGRSGRDPGGTLLLIRTKQRLTPSVRSILNQLDESWSLSLDPREIR